MFCYSEGILGILLVSKFFFFSMFFSFFLIKKKQKIKAAFYPFLGKNLGIFSKERLLNQRWSRSIPRELPLVLYAIFHWKKPEKMMPILFLCFVIVRAFWGFYLWGNSSFFQYSFLFSWCSFLFAWSKRNKKSRLHFILSSGKTSEFFPKKDC